MSQLPVAYVDFRFSVHATEDLDKVMQAVNNVLPPLEDYPVEFTKNELEGHYGNPIVFFEVRIKNKKVVKALIDNIAANLSTLDKEELSRDMDKYFEKGSLYIRIDKQAAYQGKIKFVNSDPIRIRIRFRTRKLESAIETCKEIGMLL